MIIAIDETGSFNEGRDERNFFIAVHLRQRKTLYKQKAEQFRRWESRLSSSLKNHKGEIKAFSVDDAALDEFARSVMRSYPFVGITPIAMRPAENPKDIVEKHKLIALTGIREGTKWYEQNGRIGPARIYNELGNWFERLNYQQYLKVLALGYCISESFVNAVGHSISGHYDDELIRIRFKIDRDFVREPRTEVFWREILRNQLYFSSQRNPIPILNEWEEKGHRFLDKYHSKGYFDFNDLFQNNCDFLHSHEHFEIRMADAVNTIFSRFLNHRHCREAYDLLRPCILRDGSVQQMILNDVDLSKWRYDPSNNPFAQFPPEPSNAELEDDRG